MFSPLPGIFVFSSPPPGGGNEWIFLLEQNADYMLIAGRFKFATAAGGSVRTVHIQLVDVSQVLMVIEPPATQAAAMSQFYSFGPFGGSRSNLGTNESMMNWPMGVMLKANWTIRTLTTNIAGGDVFSFIEIGMMRWAHRTV